MSTRLVILAFAVILPILTVAQVSVDTSLLHNAESWKPKVNLFPIAGVLKKVSVGPLETVSVGKGERNIVSSKKSKSLNGNNGAWGLRKTYSAETRRPFNLTILHNGSDSIFLNMNMVIIEEGERAVLNLSKKRQDNERTVTKFCAEASIEIADDTTQWLVRRNETGDSWGLSNEATWSMYSSGDDSISVHHARDFKKSFFQTFPEGIVFIRKGEQIAAYQRSPRLLLLRKDLNDVDRRVLGIALISILADYNNGY